MFGSGIAVVGLLGGLAATKLVGSDKFIVKVLHGSEKPLCDEAIFEETTKTLIWSKFKI
jgi:hypothetical protein